MSVRDPRKIYISNIPHGCRERDLGRLFEELGRILLVDYKNKFAFIEYERSNAAADAIYKYDGIEFMGRRLRVEPYCYRGGDRKYRPDQEAHDYRIIVTGVDSFTSWQDLKDFGRTAGRSVTFADIREIEDRHGHRISEGIIEYANTDDYESALAKLNGARLNGARVQVRAVEQGDDDMHDRKRFKEHDGGRRKFDGYRRRSRSRDRDFRRHERKQYERRRHRSRSRSYSRSRSRSHSHRRNDEKNDDGDGKREKKHRRRERSSSSRSGKRFSPHSQKSRSVSHHSTKKESHSKSRSPSRT